jgi:hypothetical protein
MNVVRRIRDASDGSSVYRIGTYAYLFLAAIVFFTLIGVLVVLPDAVRNPDNRVFDAIWLALLGRLSSLPRARSKGGRHCC